MFYEPLDNYIFSKVCWGIFFFSKKCTDITQYCTAHALIDLGVVTTELAAHVTVSLGFLNCVVFQATSSNVGSLEWNEVNI